MSRQALAGSGRMPWPVLKPLSSQLSRSIRVARQVCLVGAHPRVHLPLHSPMVSRTHALIVIDGAETFIRDLASRNGVYVNGHVIRESRLRHGDLLCVGPYAFWWSATPLPSPRPRHLSSGTQDSAALISVIGEKSPRRFAGQTFVIGRREECDLVSDSNWVAPVHAVIYRRARSYYLRDLNSKTGTFVNTRRVREIELQSGDEIRIGLTRMRFEPPEEHTPTDDGGDETGQDLAGLDALFHADHPVAGSEAAAKACPTIEQLLGAAPMRITHWERPRNRMDSGNLGLPIPSYAGLA